MFCADCSSILFEVINTHSLISCTILYSLCWWVSVLVFLCGGTITNVQLWLSMSDEVFVPLICIYIWLDCTVCAICVAPPFYPFQAIYSSFYTTTCYHSEDLLYVKSRTWSSLHIFFYNTVCLSWHAENDTVNMTFSSLRYVC